MDREQVKGAAEKAKGAIKDTAGKVTDDKKLQTEGKFDKAKGSAHNVAGDIKDAVKQSNIKTKTRTGQAVESLLKYAAYIYRANRGDTGAHRSDVAVV
jgi:uncharacterized protein YjbJ (UPF0337 family)